MERMYRYQRDIPVGISLFRYGRVLPFLMNGTTIWAAAIKRLMASKGFDSAAALIRSAAERHIKLRPNTVSDAVNKPRPRMDTLQKMADALDVPLWALYCSESEYAAFTDALAHKQAQLQAQQSDDELVSRILTHITPAVRDAITDLKKGENQPEESAEPRPRPVPVPKHVAGVKKTR